MLTEINKFSVEFLKLKEMRFCGYVIRNWKIIGLIEGKRASGCQRDISAKDEWNDAHRTDSPCLREGCLVAVVEIAAYVNMIWHTMMMMNYTGGV